MVINLILKAIFIYTFKWGVLGAGASTLFSIAFIGIMLTVLSCHSSNLVHIDRINQVELDIAMIQQVLGMGIPNSIENGMFQLGILLLQRLTASFGTVSIAANAILKTLTPSLCENWFGFCIW